MSRIHPLSIIIFLTGVVLAIVGIVLAIVFGVQHAKEQSCPVCPVQNNCQASLFSLRTGLQGVTWTPNLDVVGSPEFDKQQTIAQNQLQAVLQNSLAPPSSSKASRLAANTDGNNVIVSVTKFALASDGVTVIAFASGAVTGSQTGITDLPTNYTTTFQQSLDQDDQVAKGGAVVSDDSTSMCEKVDDQLPALVTSATARPTPKATTATCAPCPTTHTVVPTSCPHCPSCPTQPVPTHCPKTTCAVCPKPTACPTDGYLTTMVPTTCPDCPAATSCPEPTACPTAGYETTMTPTTCPECPMQTDCPVATSCPEPTACPTDPAVTTAVPVTCPVCPTEAAVTCPACPKPTACPTTPFITTLKPTDCPVCPTQPATTCPACPQPTACPTQAYETTMLPTKCPVCPTQPTSTCPTCSQPTACPTTTQETTMTPTSCPVCPTQPVPTQCSNTTCPACPTEALQTTVLPSTCPSCPPPVTCSTNPPTTTPKIITTPTTAAPTTSAGCTGIFEGDIALVYEQTMTSVRTGIEQQMQAFMAGPLLFGSGLPYVVNGLTTRVQLFPYGDTDEYTKDTDFEDGPHFSKEMYSLFATYNDIDSERNFDEPIINDGLISVMEANGHGQRNGAVIIVGNNGEFVMDAFGTAQALQLRGWELFVVSFDPKENFSGLAPAANIYYRNSSADETGIASSIGQKLMQLANPGCGPSISPVTVQTPTPTTKKSVVCSEIFEGDIAVVFEETLTMQKNDMEGFMQTYITNSLIFHKDRPYNFNGVDSRVQLFPYGYTVAYNIDLRFVAGPQNKLKMKNNFDMINTYNEQMALDKASIYDGLNSLLASTDHGSRYGAVIIVADSDQYVRKSLGSAESLQQKGWDIFVVSTNEYGNFSRLTTTDNIYYRTGFNDDIISNSIAQKLVARSNNGCVPTGPTTATVTAPTTTKSTQCASQSFYYGDIAIVFEQTQTEISIIPYAIHNFISFRLLSYFKNPYIIDGNTTRILLAPYGNTVQYKMSNSYAEGPSSLDQLLNVLEPLDNMSDAFDLDSPNMKDGLSFVRTARNHDERAGSVIIIGMNSEYVRTSGQASKALQRAGYNVFTVTFEDQSDLGPLASKPEYAFKRYYESDETSIAEKIGAAILSTSPCDPNPPTQDLTTVALPENYYQGKVAVIFEQTMDNVDSGREHDIHDFITRRLFYYPGTVFFLPEMTKALLFPYGNTSNYDPSQYYTESVRSMEEIGDQMEDFDELNQYFGFRIPNMEDGLLWVLNNVGTGTDGQPMAAIIIGYSDQFVQSSTYIANSLKHRGYQILTVSFNESSVFDPLASSSDCVFTRRSVSDEINIARSIGEQMLIGPPTFAPTTTATKAPTTTKAAPDCNTFYGNLAIVFEQTTDLVYSQDDDEQLIHNYIKNSLLAYKGNPYQVDGTTSRIMLAPYGDTSEYPGTYQSWEKGPTSLEELTSTLQKITTKTEKGKLNDPKIEDGLAQIQESFDTENRLAAVVLIGYSNKYIRQSEIQAKSLQKAGYHVFTISFSTTDYSPLASDANSTFVRKILAQEDIISKKIGTWLVEQQQCASTKPAKATTQPAPVVTTGLPATTAALPACSFYGNLAIVFEETMDLITSNNEVEDEIHNFIRGSLLTYNGNPYVVDGNTTRIMLAPYGNTQSYPGVNYRWQNGPSSLSQLNGTLRDMYSKTEINELNVPDITDGLTHVQNSFGADARVSAIVIMGYSDEYIANAVQSAQKLRDDGYHVFTISFNANTDFSSLGSDFKSTFVRTNAGSDDNISRTIGNWLSSQLPCTTIKPTNAPVTKPASECSSSFFGDMAVVFEQTVDLISSSNRQESILHNYILDSLLSYKGNPYLIDGTTSRIMLTPYGSPETYEDTWQSWTSVPKSFNELNQTLTKFNKQTVLNQINNPDITDGFEHVQLTTDRDGRQSVIVLIGHSDKYIESSLVASKKLQAAGYHVFTISFNPDANYVILASDTKSNFVRNVQGLGDDISEYIGTWIMSQQQCTTKSTQEKTSTLPPPTPTSSCPEQNIYYGDVAVVYEETQDVSQFGSGYELHDFIAFRLFGYANNPYIVDGDTSRILMVPYGETNMYKLNNSYAYGPKSLEALNNMMTPIDEDRIEYGSNDPNMKTGLDYVRSAINHKGRVGSVIIIGLSDSYALSSISSSKALQRAGYNVLTVSFNATGDFSKLASRPDLVFIRNSEQDEFGIAEKIGKFLKSTSPCDPVPPTEGLPTTVITPTNKYTGNIAVLLEQTWDNDRKGIGAAIHDFIMYRLFNYPGNPYQFPDKTRALLAPYGLTGYYNLPTNYSSGSIRNQDDISDQLENFNILSDYYYVKTTDISDGLYYLIDDVNSEPQLAETVIIIGYSDEYVYNATIAAATLAKQGYTFITVSFNPKANFSPLASGTDHSFYRNSEQDELNIAKSITELLMNPTSAAPSTVQPTSVAVTTPVNCDEQNFYYGDIAIVFEETMDNGRTIHDFIAFKLLSYIGSPYIVDGITSRILLVPYGNTGDYGANTSYANGPRAIEDINNLLEPMDEFCTNQQLNSPNIKEGLQFVKTAQDHDGRAGNVILIGKSAAYAKGSVGSSTALQKAGYNVFTVSFLPTGNLGQLASNASYVFTRKSTADEDNIAKAIGSFILQTSRCDPLPQPTGPTTTITTPVNPYVGNIAVIFEQTLYGIENGHENAIHDFLTYRLFYYPGNPYDFSTVTKTILVPYGSTTKYNPSNNYGASPRNQGDISDELENFDDLTHEFMLESVDIRDGIEFVEKVPNKEKVPYTAIIIGYSDDFVQLAKITSLSLQSIGYKVFTVSFNGSTPLDPLATSAAYSFTRNSEQDEINIARSIGNMLITPTSAAPTTVQPVSTAAVTTPASCNDQQFYYGDVAIVFEETTDVQEFGNGRTIHDFIAFKLLTYNGSPYIVDGITSRILLVPYGNTADYGTNNSYAYGPRALEDINNLLEPIGDFCEYHKLNSPNIKDGLQFVQAAQAHEGRAGNVILIGKSAAYAKASVGSSKALQKAGYNVFTVSWSSTSDLSSLASDSKYVFTRKSAKDEATIAEAIGTFILPTSRCDPLPQPTGPTTTVNTPANPYAGNIAVIFEQNMHNIDSGRENEIHDFLTYRLFYYPGNPYNFQKNTNTLLVPYGETSTYNPSSHYGASPRSMGDISDELENFDYLSTEYFLDSLDIRSGIEFVEKVPLGQKVPYTAIIVGYSNEFVQLAKITSLSLQSIGYKVFTVSFNGSTPLDPLATSAAYSFTRNSEQDEINIARSIGNMLTSPPTTAVPSTPSLNSASTVPTYTGTTTGSSCVNQSVYYGDIAIVFEQTMNALQDKDARDIHEFIVFKLLGVKNSPYLLDGETTRLIIVPYGYTADYATTSNYSKGPTSQEMVSDTLDDYNRYTIQYALNYADIKEGLQLVQKSTDHGSRVGSVIIVGFSSQLMQAAIPYSQALQTAGYSVFTVSFAEGSSLAPLASQPSYAFMRQTLLQEDTIAEEIAQAILATTPCDPNNIPTVLPTTVIPPAKPYFGDIAVVYELTGNAVISGTENLIHNFITFRLFNYPGNPYVFDQVHTAMNLIPYGQTSSYRPYPYYSQGPKTQSDILDLLSNNGDLAYQETLNTVNMEDGLRWVSQNAEGHAGRPGAVFIIGFSDQFVASSKLSSENLQDAEYQVFTISFNPASNFAPLASVPQYAFTRTSESDEIGIAEQIGSILIDGPSTSKPSTNQPFTTAATTNQPGSTAPPASIKPATTVQTTVAHSVGPTQCPGQNFYYGDLAIVFEETYDLVEDMMERMVHDFISINLLNYANNPYIIDGKTSRILLVPYGETSSFKPTNSYKTGPSSLEILANKLEGFDLTVVFNKGGTPNIKTGLQFVKSAEDHDNRVGAVVIVGVNDQFVTSSVASSKALQSMGYTVFTVSFDTSSDFSSLASKPEFAFTAVTQTSTDNAVHTIGNYLLSTSPCDPVHLPTYPPTTPIPFVGTPYIGNIVVVFEEEPMELDSQLKNMHNFITYRLFYYDGNPYRIGKETQILLIPYGFTEQFNPTTAYEDGPFNQEEIAYELETFDQLFEQQQESNSYEIKDGLKFVQKKTTTKRQVPTTVIIIGSNSVDVIGALKLASTLKQSGYQIFTVCFDPLAELSPLSSGVGYAYRRINESDEDGIAKAIANMLVSGPPTTIQASTRLPTTKLPSTPVPASIYPPTHCPGQNFYYGDLAIVFEETYTAVTTGVEQSIHNFINFDLLSYPGNPYRIDGVTTRILLAPYGGTNGFEPETSYKNGPSSMERLATRIEDYDLHVVNSESGTPNIKVGLQFVKSADDHGNRVGSVIIIGASGQFIKSSVASSQNLQSMGYNVFTVAFEGLADFSSLASKPEFAFNVGSQNSIDKAVQAIGNYMLTTSPCDPVPPPSYPPTTPSPATKTPYIGNIAVVFEEEPMDLDDNEVLWHRFITYRLFTYDGNPYNLGKQTQIILVPYGDTDQFNPTTDYANGPISIEEIANEIENFDQLFEGSASNSYDIRDGLKFVEKETTSKRKVPTTVIIIGQAGDYIQKTIPLANTLKQSGYHVFTVSFDKAADFGLLSSGSGYSFTRNKESDEVNIAKAIAAKLEAGSSTTQPPAIQSSTTLPLTTQSASTIATTALPSSAPTTIQTVKASSTLVTSGAPFVASTTIQPQSTIVTTVAAPGVPSTNEPSSTLMTTVPTTEVPTTNKPESTMVTTVATTGAPTNCPGQDFYYGDIAIVFEETWNLMDDESEQNLHNFITYNLLFYLNNPYRIDGNTSRILLVPYGNTKSFTPETSYQKGPSSIEELANKLESFDLFLVDTEIGTPDMKDGLQFVKSAKDHENRVGSVIIVGYSDQYVRTAVASSKNLQTMGYNVFTISFEAFADFSSLASKPEFAYNILVEADKNTISSKIGANILTTSPCDPVPPPTYPPTTPAPAAKTPYVGNIAVVFEETVTSLAAGNETSWHNFITYRLFAYDGNPYNLGAKTQILLIPYGETDQFNPTKAYSDGPNSIIEIANELENFDQSTDSRQFNSFDIRDGLKFVQKETKSRRKVPTTVIIIGQNAQFVTLSIPLAKTLKESGMEVFTVSFNPASNFSPLSSGDGYSFVRKSEADEVGIARAIGEKLDSNPVTLPPASLTPTMQSTRILTTTNVPKTNSVPKSTASTDCKGQTAYYGDLAILYEESDYAHQIGILPFIQNFIAFHLLSPGNPFVLDGNTTRIMMVPFGNTRDFTVTEYYSKGPRSVEDVTNTMDANNILLQEFSVNPANMKDGLNFVKSAEDHGNRAGSIVIVGNSYQFVSSSVATSKQLQRKGYNVFTVSIGLNADLSSLASKADWVFSQVADEYSDIIAKSIGKDILATSPCDPFAIPTSIPTSPIPTGQPTYRGNIAVVFEEGYIPMQNGNGARTEDFILYRLFFYPGSPYQLSDIGTKILLIPYGQTTQYNPSTAFKYGPTTQEDLAEELQNYNYITEELKDYDTYVVKDGLDFVLNSVKDPGAEPKSIIIIGSEYTNGHIANAVPTANKLKKAGWDIFSVSFAPIDDSGSTDFTPLTSGPQYSFIRNTEANEIGIAQSIEQLLVSNAPTMPSVAPTQPSCKFNGDISVLIEQTLDNIKYNRETQLHNFVSNALFTYPGNPYQIDGNTSRVLLVPYGITVEYDVQEKYSTGTKSVAELPTDLAHLDAQTNTIYSNTGRISDGLTFVTKIKDHSDHQGVVVIVGFNFDDPDESMPLSKTLQSQGYHVFAVSFDPATNLSVLASDSQSNFLVNSPNDFVDVARAIGSILVPGCSQTTGSLTTIMTHTSVAVATSVPVTTDRTQAVETNSSPISTTSDLSSITSVAPSTSQAPQQTTQRAPDCPTIFDGDIAVVFEQTTTLLSNGEENKIHQFISSSLFSYTGNPYKIDGNTTRLLLTAYGNSNDYTTDNYATGPQSRIEIADILGLYNEKTNDFQLDDPVVSEGLTFVSNAKNHGNRRGVVIIIAYTDVPLAAALIESRSLQAAGYHVFTVSFNAKTNIASLASDENSVFNRKKLADNDVIARAIGSILVPGCSQTTGSSTTIEAQTSAAGTTAVPKTTDNTQADETNSLPVLTTSAPGSMSSMAPITSSTPQQTTQTTADCPTMFEGDIAVVFEQTTTLLSNGEESKIHQFISSSLFSYTGNPYKIGNTTRLLLTAYGNSNDYTTDDYATGPESRTGIADRLSVYDEKTNDFELDNPVLSEGLTFVSNALNHGNRRGVVIIIAYTDEPLAAALIESSSLQAAGYHVFTVSFNAETNLASLASDENSVFSRKKLADNDVIARAIGSILVPPCPTAAAQDSKTNNT